MKMPKTMKPAVLLDVPVEQKHLKAATDLIVAAQRDLGRDLSAGPMRDLLADNLPWTQEMIERVVSKLPHPRDHFICIGPNVWGKADSEVEAVKNMLKEDRTAKRWIVYSCTSRTYVNDMGGLNRPAIDPEAVIITKVEPKSKKKKVTG